MRRRAEAAAVVLGLVVFAPRMKEPERPEAVALATLRAMLSLEGTYAAVSGGYYGTPDCLASVECLPVASRPAQPFLPPHLAGTLKQGTGSYRFEFHAGPEDVPAAAARRPEAGMSRFAIVAEPLTDTSSRRSFCVDDRGTIFTTKPGTRPSVNAGRCLETDTPLR